MPRPVEFWFEFASPYSYIAAMGIEAAAAEAGVPVRWRPFLLGPVFKAQGWDDSPFNLYPAKGAYLWRDMARECARLGLPFGRPSAFPRGSLPAARLLCAAPDAPWRGAFARAVFTANFAEDRAIDTADVVAEILVALGLDPDPLIARAQSDGAKAALRAATAEAMAAGLFGAPSFVVGGELFWGNERRDSALAVARAA
ncbi:MAG: 2-hydroxychromene-2-carboxylate isomerase [Rhodobacteraceae bacterium]|jgi:2-hydroxychromene-2-carboxylate isomerase|nr:2-hydroxychromene-2-carboxylate isomerase [Paracoccaceae bacterium]MBL4557966.1 2-hydroxychromene-2-carboxylate isomerase [Paracoccaceae bacterium]